MEKDLMAKLTELKASKKELTDKGIALAQEDKFEELENVNTQLDAINNSIAATEKLLAKSMENAEPVATVTEVKNDTEKPLKLFNSLGEQLQAVHNAAKGKGIDTRLLKLNNAVAGASEGLGSGGGFAVQTDFAGSILESAASESEILSRVDSYTVGANSNSAKWLMVDETDVSASVFGGVQMYWASEGATVNASRPKFKEMKLDLEKMMGFAYATDELLEDAAFMSGFFGTAFQLAADRLLTAAIISGDGAGKPLGILKSPALVTVAKESGQAADTLVGANVVKMWQRADIRRRKNAVWIMHPDVEEQLPTLSVTSGTETKFLWAPEGGFAAAPYQTIFGRPIIFDDNCAGLGDAGDVVLADLQQYMLLKKGRVKQDWSLHVELLTDQNCFRMVLRANGAPKVSSPVKIKNSQKTRSPFVTLAARA